jgi:hypothetical protein
MQRASYSVVCLPMNGAAYRTYGHTHAANHERPHYRTLCGKRMYADDFHCFADEKHTITCAKCRKALGL